MEKSPTLSITTDRDPAKPPLIYRNGRTSLAIDARLTARAAGDSSLATAKSLLMTPVLRLREPEQAGRLAAQLKFLVQPVLHFPFDVVAQQLRRARAGSDQVIGLIAQDRPIVDRAASRASTSLCARFGCGCCNVSTAPNCTRSIPHAGACKPSSRSSIPRRKTDHRNQRRHHGGRGPVRTSSGQAPAILRRRAARRAQETGSRSPRLRPAAIAPTRTTSGRCLWCRGSKSGASNMSRSPRRG